MYYGKVEISGINTSKLRVLSEEEKSELLEKTAKGDMKAREELINGNLRLVLSVIQKFTGRGESPDDLFQVGVIGLIKAIDNFSAEFGVKFSTYAVPMIEGEVKRHIRDSGQQSRDEHVPKCLVRTVYHIVYISPYIRRDAFAGFALRIYKQILDPHFRCGVKFKPGRCLSHASFLPLRAHIIAKRRSSRSSSG